MIDPRNPTGDAITMSGQTARTRTLRTNFKWSQYLPSLTSFLLLVYLIVALFMNGGMRAYRRGFFCNDSTIQYPFKKDTVNFRVLIIMSLILPWLVIRLLEKKLIQLLNDSYTRPRSRSSDQSADDCSVSRAEEEGLMQTGDIVKRRLVVNDNNDSDVEACDTEPAGACAILNGGETNGVKVEQDIHANDVRFRIMMKRVSTNKRPFSDAQLFLFGLVTTAFLTGIGKMTCGRYRPHFMQQCRPNIDCSMQSNLNRYIEDFECTNESMKARDFTYITTSWPSGHASIVFYSMLYMVYYMNAVIQAIIKLRTLKRVRTKFNPIFMYSVYVLMIGFATYVSLTRVSDYHHHPTDVLSGVVIGTLVAYTFAVQIFRPILETAVPT